MSNMDKPILSVVIPCWNAEEHLSTMLTSVKNQSFREWVTYIIDDGSNDNSREIANSFCLLDRRFNLIKRERKPKGAQTCRNIGLDLSIGTEYVMILDADDVLAPFCFEQRVSYLQRHPELEFAIFPAKNFKQNINHEESTCFWGYPFFSDDIKSIIDGTITMVGWTNIYRISSLLEHCIRWDENILSLQDSDWNLACLLENLKYGYAVNEGAKYDYYYRISSTNSIAKKINSPRHLENHLSLLSKWSVLLCEKKEQLGNAKYSLYSKSLQARYAYIVQQIICSGMLSLLPNFPTIRSNTSFKIRYALLRLLQYRGYRFIFRHEIHYRYSVLRGWTEKLKLYSHEIFS